MWIYKCNTYTTCLCDIIFVISESYYTIGYAECRSPKMCVSHCSSNVVFLQIFLVLAVYLSHTRGYHNLCSFLLLLLYFTWNHATIVFTLHCVCDLLHQQSARCISTIEITPVNNYVNGLMLSRQTYVFWMTLWISTENAPSNPNWRTCCSYRAIPRRLVHVLMRELQNVRANLSSAPWQQNLMRYAWPI